MTKSTKAKLAYQKAYNAQPRNVKKREMNNAARAELMKKGVVSKGDGMDVDHKKMLDVGGTNTPSNLRAVTEKTNRSWRKKYPKVYG